MQHNGRHWRKERLHEAKTADLLHEGSEGTDVGATSKKRF